MFRSFASILAALVLACSAHAEESDPFDALEGRWAGEGVFQGRAVEASAEFAEALGGRWRTLTISYAPRDPEAGAPFFGRAWYLVAEDGAITGRWLDSLGANLALAARFEDGALIVDWGDETMRGTSRYAIAQGGALIVEDAFFDGEVATLFTEAALERARSPEEVVAAMFEAFNRHDADALAALYAQDARVTSPDHAPLVGPEAVRAHYQGMFDALASVRDDVVTMVAQGDTVAVAFVASWETDEGREELPIAAILVVRGGLIVSDAAYFDAP